jgi:hypothetical protein
LVLSSVTNYLFLAAEKAGRVEMATRRLRLCGLLGCVLALAFFALDRPDGVHVAQAAMSPAPDASDKKHAKPAADKVEHLPVRLGKVPELALAPRFPLNAKQVARLKAQIARLADIDSPDYGLSSTMSGDAFLPLAGQRRAGAFLLTDHRLKSSHALKTLVEAGPDALPLLLDALDDKTPTKLKVEHRGFGGTMWLANELWGNPVNPVEVRVLGLREKRRPRQAKEKHIESYAVKIGDVCMVAIGQIVGRGYQAVRYQPTACIVINSPTEDAELRGQVRAIWSSKDPARRLFDSLLLDYATVGNYKEGDSFDRWGVGSELQIAAAMRMLYYFPKETGPMIARRLRGLRVHRVGPGAGTEATADEMAAWARREVANGARTEELVRAVSWCKEPEVRDSLRSIFKRTGDVDILLAAMPALDEKLDVHLIRTRMASFLENVRKDERGAYSDGYNLLVAAEQRLGAAARQLFERYLEGAGPMRRYSVCQALQCTKDDWSIDLLGHLLDDKRPVGGYTHPASKNDRENGVKIRVCDAAAETLSRRHPRLTFEMVGTDQELDRQIRVMRELLARTRR